MIPVRGGKVWAKCLARVWPGRYLAMSNGGKMNNRGKEMVLLVEANPDDVFLTVRALRSQGATGKVWVARDGVEALDYMKGRGRFADREAYPLPTMVLLDLNLPKMDGLAVLKGIRATEAVKTTPVVVLSSVCSERDLHECYRLGANSFIRKPADYNQFAELVRKLGSYWLELNESPPPVE